MALKKQHRIAEMMTKDTKMSWNCNSDRSEKSTNTIVKYQQRLPPQNAKQQVLKFRLGTYITPKEGLMTDPNKFHDFII